MSSEMEEAPPHKLLTLLAQLTLFSLLSLPTLKKRWHAGFHMSMTFPNLCTYPPEKNLAYALLENMILGFWPEVQALITLPVQNILPLKHVHHCVCKTHTRF